MADDRPLIVVAGESLIDRIVRPDGRREAVPGGGPFTTARALGRLGCRVAFLGRLSSDSDGRLLRSLLVDDGVDLAVAATSDEPTLQAIAELDGRGAASYRFEPPGSAAAGLRPGDVPAGLPAETAVLHVGTLGLVLEPTATTIAGLVAATPPGILVMLDPNIRPLAIADPAAYRARLDAVVRRADVVKVSVDDLRWLEPAVAPIDAARHIAAMGPAVVLVTDGASPVRIVRPAGVREVEAPRVRVVDTVGAGDAFGAGFLAAWTDARRSAAGLGDEAAVVEAVRFAVRVASWTVGRAGADPPTRAELGPVDGRVR